MFIIVYNIVNGGECLGNLLFMSLLFAFENTFEVEPVLTLTTFHYFSSEIEKYAQLNLAYSILLIIITIASRNLYVFRINSQKQE